MTSPDLWRLDADGPAAPLEAAAEAASLADPPLAAAVSIFETERGRRRLELVFEGEPDRASLLAGLGLAKAEGVTITLAPLPARDWVALSLEGLPPVEAGRFRLRGSHTPPRRGGVDLLIEAGEAFGTGHHGTTRGCLLALDAILKHARPRRVCDLGTGTGALAIAAARALRRPVLATDIDPVAVAVAQTNAKLAGVDWIVTAVVADGARDLRRRGRGFDLVFANILPGPLVAMAGDVAGIVAPGGRLVLSGILLPQRRMVDAAYRGRGLVRERDIRLEGWVSLVLRRPGGAAA